MGVNTSTNTNKHDLMSSDYSQRTIQALNSGRPTNKVALYRMEDPSHVKQDLETYRTSNLELDKLHIRDSSTMPTDINKRMCFLKKQRNNYIHNTVKTKISERESKDK